jgi:hypothetical protein
MEKKTSDKRVIPKLSPIKTYLRKYLEQIPTLEMVWVRSERRGISRRPSPPSLRGVFIHARWVKWESTLQATT